MLKGDGNTSCTSCHESQGTFTHPVGEGILDHRNRQIITCLTCHDPKGTDYENNLRLDQNKELCVQCHRY
jgi:predicted CXXCH cytochrome family protein